MPKPNFVKKPIRKILDESLGKLPNDRRRERLEEVEDSEDKETLDDFLRRINHKDKIGDK